MLSFLDERLWIYSLLIITIYPVMFDSPMCLCSRKKNQGRNQKSILLKDKTSAWFSREKRGKHIYFYWKCIALINAFCTGFKVKHLFTFITCNHISDKWCSSTTEMYHLKHYKRVVHSSSSVYGKQYKLHKKWTLKQNQHSLYCQNYVGEPDAFPPHITAGATNRTSSPGSKSASRKHSSLLHTQRKD